MVLYWQYAAIVFGAISAIAWLIAAIIPTPLPKAYLSGPPEKVIRRIRAQSLGNSIGAGGAAISVACQAVNLYLTLPDHSSLQNFIGPG